MQYAQEMTATPVEVPDELFAELRKRLSDSQLVELTAAISWENFKARFYHALDIQSQDYSAGAYCPLPEHPAPKAKAVGT